MNRLEALHDAGVSIWLDTLSRELLDSGDFARLIADSAVTGATSNPTIFAKAITNSDRYDDQLRALVASGVRAPHELFFALALDDVRRAADLLRPAYDESAGRDGFVSFECTPDLADDSEATIEQALELWGRLARPNVMIKVEKAMKAHPLGLWVKRQRGLGLKQVARLLAAIGDLLMNEAEGVPGAARPSCGPPAATRQASGASADARRYRASAHKQPRGGSDISDHTPKPSGSSRYSSRSGLTTEAVGADHCTAAVIASGRRRESQWRSTVTEWLTEARSSGPRRPGTRSPGARMSLDRASRSLLS